MKPCIKDLKNGKDKNHISCGNIVFISLPDTGQRVAEAYGRYFCVPSCI